MAADAHGRTAHERWAAWWAGREGRRLRNDVRTALRALAATRRRRLAALLGMAIGTASVVAMLSASAMAREQALRQFRGIDPGVLLLHAATPLGDHRRSSGLRVADVRALPAQCPHVAAAAPLLLPDAEVVLAGRRLRASAIGIGPGYAAILPARVAAGRFLSEADPDAAFCVVGARVARQIETSGRGETLGRRLRVGGGSVIVAGVLEAGAGALGPLRLDDAVLVPLASLASVVPETPLVDVLLRLDADAPRETALAEVRDFLGRRGYALGLEALSPEQALEQMGRETRLFTLLLGAVGSLSLLGGGVGVMNGMLASLLERREEIGIRRALGARRSDIRAQFLAESLILSVLAGALGLLVGLAGACAIAVVSGWPLVVSPAGMLLSAAVTVVTGAFFGLHPAERAARLDPVAALQPQ